MRNTVIYGLLAAIFVLSVAGVVGVYDMASDYFVKAEAAKLRLSIVEAGAKALVQLSVIGVLGAAVKYLFDSHREESRRLDAWQEFWREILQRMTLARQRVLRARQLLRAQKSAKTYRDQIYEIIDASSELESIEQDVNIAQPADGVAHVQAQDSIRKARSYLSDLIEEWTDKYPTAATLQEADRKEAVKEYLATKCTKLIDFKEENEISEFPAEFEAPYAEAISFVFNAAVAKRSSSARRLP